MLKQNTQRMIDWTLRLGLCCTLSTVAWGLWPGLPTQAPVHAEELKVKYKADKVEYLENEGLFRLIGNVELQVKDYVIKTQQLDYNSQAKTLKSDTLFEIVQRTPQGDRRIKGKTFRYDVGLRRIEATDVYLVVPATTVGQSAVAEGQEIYIQGDWMTAYDDGARVVMGNGFYTTCDHIQTVETTFQELSEDPYAPEVMKKRITHYAIEAEILDFIPDDRVMGWNTRFLNYESQTFWFPLVYLPLSGAGFGLTKPDLDVGQNPVEGFFARFKGDYRFNEYHDGRWFVEAMEKKGMGFGFEHDWIAAPSSITRFFFFGLPVTDSIFSPQSLFLPPNSGEVVSGTDGTAIATTGLRNDPSRFLLQQEQSVLLPGVSDWLSNKFDDYKISITHRQLLLPHTEVLLNYQDIDFYNTGFQASRTTNRSFSFDLIDQQIFPVDPHQDLVVDTNVKLTQSVQAPQTALQVANTGTGNTSVTQQPTFNINENQQRTIDIKTRLGQANLNINTNWSEAASRSVTQTIENGVPQNRQETVNNQSDSLRSGVNLNIPIDEKTQLTTRFDYVSNLSNITPQNRDGNWQQTLTPNVTLTQQQPWGRVNLTYADFFDLNGRSSNTGQVKKLPEMDFTFNPLFNESFPLTFRSTIGRYFEPASFIPTDPLNEISRALFDLSLGGKEYDLGLGNKVSFAGTKFEQRFYQTLDAAYLLTGSVNYKNDITPYFVPSFNYRRTVLDEENNNTPFRFDTLSLNQQNLLTGSIGLVNLPEFTMDIRTGYDYNVRRYQPVTATFRSQIGNHFVFNGQTGYNPLPVTDRDVGNVLRYPAGVAEAQANPYLHGPNQQTIPISEADVGSFSLYGGTWQPSTLGFRYRSTEVPLAMGAFNTYGLESGVPEGYEMGLNLGYDFDQGRINNLSGLVNVKLADSFLGLMDWDLGGKTLKDTLGINTGADWLWHTELTFQFAVQPTFLPENGQEWLALVVPFKITLRKDLHDFMFEMAYDTFFQQFTMNLTLLAFPEISTNSLLKNIDQANQGVGSLNNQLNQGVNSIGN